MVLIISYRVRELLSYIVCTFTKYRTLFASIFEHGFVDHIPQYLFYINLLYIIQKPNFLHNPIAGLEEISKLVITNYLNESPDIKEAGWNIAIY